MSAEALKHARKCLECIASFGDPEEIIAEPEDFGGTDDPLETLSMAYDNMKFAARRGLEEIQRILGEQPA